MTESALRVAYVVAAESDPRSAWLTTRSILRQDPPPAGLVVAADVLREHAFAGLSEPARSPVLVEFVSCRVLGIGPRYMAGLRSIADKADVVVLCREGTLFRPDHLAELAALFGRRQELVGLMQQAGSVRRMTSDAGADQNILDESLSGAAPDAAPRAWLAAARRSVAGALRSRSLTASMLAVRLTSFRGLSLSEFGTGRSDFLSFASCLDRLRPRGRVMAGASAKLVELRYGDDQRQARRAGREAFLSLSRFRGEASSLVVSAPAEIGRLLAEAVAAIVSDPARRAWALDFMRGMRDGLREAGLRRK